VKHKIRCETTEKSEEEEELKTFLEEEKTSVFLGDVCN